MDNHVVSSVFSSSDYDAFNRLSGNRKVLDQRKNLIVASIKERGWIRNPIVVNEKMEIIDGQGRYEALRHLKMPIEYVISEGATIDDCIALNLKQKNWNPIDYIHCYADMGYPEYDILLGLIHRFGKNLPLSVIVGLCSPACSFNDGTNKAIKNGTFAIYDKEIIDDLMSFVNECLTIIYQSIGTGCGRSRTWAAALKFIYYSRCINCQDFIKRLKKYPLMLKAVATNEQAVTVLGDLYNYNKSKRIYFLPEYDKYRRGELIA